jgi:hypothetical protein
MSVKVGIAQTTNFLPMPMTPVRIQSFANVIDCSISELEPNNRDLLIKN